MQWGQIKTLFILCFLILDIFLARQFILTREPNLPSIDEPSNEEVLAADIEGYNELSEEVIQESLLYAHRKQITKDDQQILDSFENQELGILDGNMIVANFKDPIPIDAENIDMETIKANILNGDQYVYWGKDEPSNTLIFFQTSRDRPIYYNQSGLLLIMLNEQGEMDYYVQTMLESEEEQQENKQELITEKDAVLYLYNDSSELSQGDKVTVKLGFHNLTSLPDGGQVLAPTWKVTVNENRNYFIHAIEGYSYPRDDSSFLRITIENILDSIPTTEDNEFYTEIRNILTKIETTSWSGEE